MRIRQFKLIGVVASLGAAVICVFLAAWLNMVLAAVCFIFIFVASAVAYYKIDKKRQRFKAHSETIYQGCKKQIAKAAVVEMSRADAVFNRPAAAQASGDEAGTAIQSSEVVSLASDEDQYSKMTDMFDNSLPSRLQEMKDALDEGNLQDLAIKVNALKGLGGLTGFGVYSAKAEALEQAVIDNQIDKVREQLDEMVQLCLKTKLTQR